MLCVCVCVDKVNLALCCPSSKFLSPAYFYHCLWRNKKIYFFSYHSFYLKRGLVKDQAMFDDDSEIIFSISP